MYPKRKLIPFIIFCLIFLGYSSSNCFAKRYQWEDISKPFKEKITIYIAAEIDVQIPAIILEKFDDIPLIIKYDQLGNTLGIQEFAELKINVEADSHIGGEGHSVFAKAFLFGLKNMEMKAFTTEELYSAHIKEMVAGSSEQTPEYNIIRNSGHEGGDFVFIKLK